MNIISKSEAEVKAKKANIEKVVNDIKQSPMLTNVFSFIMAKIDKAINDADSHVRIDLTDLISGRRDRDEICSLLAKLGYTINIYTLDIIVINWE